eukprot:423939_1
MSAGNESQPLLHAQKTEAVNDLMFNNNIDCYCIRSLTACTFTIQFLFILVLIYVIIALPVGYVEGESVDLYIFSSVLIITNIIAILAQYGIYKWGSFTDQINTLKQQNDDCSMSINGLHSVVNELKSKVKHINTKVISLEHNAKELEQTEEAFNELQNGLREICGDNVTLNEMLYEYESLYKNAHQITLQHERAWLLSTFYEVSMKDEQKGMSQREYKHFLARLPKRIRSKFAKKFESNKGVDDEMDLQEFENMINNFLDNAWIDEFSERF